MSDPEPSSGPPAALRPPPLPQEPTAIPRPGPLLGTLAYVLGLLPMAWALKASRDIANEPGDDFATLIVPGLLGAGVVGALVFGMSCALLGHSRGEPKALVALWLVPLLAVVMAGFGAILWWF